MSQPAPERGWVIERQFPNTNPPTRRPINKSISKGEKHYCEYCLSTSYDDDRGNCICCGAPRSKNTVPDIQFKYAISPVICCTTNGDEFGMDIST